MIHRLGATPDLSWLHLTALVARAHLLWETTSPLHEIRIRTTHVITSTDVGPVFVCGWAIGRNHGHGHEWRLKWWKIETKSEVSFYWLMLMRVWEKFYLDGECCHEMSWDVMSKWRDLCFMLELKLWEWSMYFGTQWIGKDPQKPQNH